MSQSIAIELTTEQTGILARINDAVHINDAVPQRSERKTTHIIISAAAGCGKTTLLQHIKHKCIFLTPTNRAKMILKRGLSGPIEVQTLHSFFELEPFLNKKGEEFYAPKDWKSEKPPVWCELANAQHNKFMQYDVVIVDECSMVEKKFYDLIYNCGCVIVWSGDNMQLPPIKESADSADWCIFDQKEHECLTLTKNLRARNTEQEILCDKVRQDPQAFSSQQKTITVHPKDVPILCFHRYRAKEHNQIHMKPGTEARPVNGSKIIFGSGALPAAHGDVPSRTIESQKNISCNPQDSQHAQLELFPGAIYEVQAVCERKEHCFNKQWECLYLKVRCVESIGGVTCWVCCVALEKKSQLRDERNKHIKVLAEQISELQKRLEDNEDVEDVVAIESDMRDCWAQRRQVLRDYRRCANTWKYAYALTIHKAQGSSFSYAVLDLNDIISSNRIGGNEYFHKMLYTAVSRGEHGSVAIKKENEKWVPIPPREVTRDSAQIKIIQKIVESNDALAKKIVNRVIQYLVYLDGKDDPVPPSLCRIRNQQPLNFVPLARLMATQQQEKLFEPGTLLGLLPSRTGAIYRPLFEKDMENAEMTFGVTWVSIKKMRTLLTMVKTILTKRAACNADDVDNMNTTFDVDDLYDDGVVIDMVNASDDAELGHAQEI